MGYYTQYTLSVDSKGPEVDNYLQSLSTENDDNYDLRALEPYSDDSWGMNAKWYGSDVDMCNLSSAFPDVMFTLTGEGEEAGDIWRTWFKNGSKYAHWASSEYFPDNPEEWRV